MFVAHGMIQLVKLTVVTTGHFRKSILGPFEKPVLKQKVLLSQPLEVASAHVVAQLIWSRSLETFGESEAFANMIQLRLS